MRLEIGNFYVREVCFGEKTSFADGLLTVNQQEALDFVRQDSHITQAELAIVHPGQMVRLCPVKEAVEPRVRVDGRALFPGYTGKLAASGNGRLHALKGCSVLAVGKHWGGFQDGLIDMGGEGAKYTHFSQLINLVLIADTDEEEERHPAGSA